MAKIKVIKERPNKFVLEYGRTIEKVAMIFGVSKATIYNWLKNEKKKAWMEEKLKEIRKEKKR